MRRAQRHEAPCPQEGLYHSDKQSICRQCHSKEIPDGGWVGVNNEVIDLLISQFDGVKI